MLVHAPKLKLSADLQSNPGRTAPAEFGGHGPPYGLLALNEQATPAGTGFVFRVDADGALARDRAFMLAHAAADTPGGVHEGTRQAHHDIHPAPFSRQAIGQGTLQGQTGSGQAGDAPECGLGRPGGTQVVVAAGQVGVGGKGRVQHHPGPLGLGRQHLSVPDGLEDGADEDGLGAHGAQFLTDQAGPVHGPGQTAAPVHEGRAHADRPLGGEVALALLFFQAQRPDGRGGADLAAGDAVGRAAAAADAVVDGRGPQALHAGLQQGGLDDVGGADAHALAAAEAAGQEALLVQGPRGPDEAGVAVGPGQAADLPHGGQEQPAAGHDQAAPGQIGQARLHRPPRPGAQR